MGLLISPQHQGSVLCLEDGYSFYKLTQRPPAHRTGRLVFGPFLFFLFFLTWSLVEITRGSVSERQSRNDRSKGVRNQSCTEDVRTSDTVGHSTGDFT